MVKLIMTWNIRPGKEPEYLDFLTKSFTEAIVAMGIQPTDAWYAVWGQGPQVLAGGVTETLADMERALASPDWTALVDRLLELVVDFEYKVVQQEGGFQL
ncbi:MAG: hypothetical protein GXY68_08755 [Chloroflexi bacterium]|jgi:hypothetical protein|nr:hypothetical protein [Chloroflexota bacterium]